MIIRKKNKDRLKIEKALEYLNEKKPNNIVREENNNKVENGVLKTLDYTAEGKYGIIHHFIIEKCEGDNDYVLLTHTVNNPNQDLDLLEDKDEDEY